MAQAYERSLLRSAVGALDHAAGDGPRLVVLGLDGAVLWSTPDAEGTLERHFGRPERAGLLPRPVTDWLDVGCPAPLVSAADGHRLRIDSLGGRPAALLLTERLASLSREALRGLGLSAREAEVLSCVALGHANSEIARQLSVSLGTVKRHLEHIYEKLGVHTRTAAAAVAWAEADPSAAIESRRATAVRNV
jgi:DNA-binding CsgD family transcriptional regulator